MSKKIVVVLIVISISIFVSLRNLKQRNSELKTVTQVNRTQNKLTQLSSNESSREGVGKGNVLATERKIESKKSHSKETNRTNNNSILSYFDSSFSEQKDRQFDSYPTVGLSNADVERVEKVNKSFEELVVSVNQLNSSYRKSRDKNEQVKIK